MDRMKSLEFLQNCLDYVYNMSDIELEKSRCIFEEELSDSKDFESDFEVVMPLETDVFFSCDDNMKNESNKKVFIDYKIPEYKELLEDELACMIAYEAVFEEV